jgi:hypothetical protein
MVKKKEKRTDGFDSDEEMYFFWYLQELEKKGYIKDIKRPDTILVIPEVKIEIGGKKVTLLQDVCYTGDFEFKIVKEHPLFDDLNKPRIKPTNRTTKVLYHQHKVVRVETKGNFDFRGKTQFFVIIQKALFNSSGKYFNLVKLPSFFEKTFTPKRYLFQNVDSKKKRLIKFKVRTLEEYES